MNKIFKLLSVIIFGFAFSYSVGFVMDTGILKDFSDLVEDHMKYIVLLVFVITAIALAMKKENLNKVSILLLVLSLLAFIVYDIVTQDKLNIGELLETYPLGFISTLQVFPAAIILVLKFGIDTDSMILIPLIIFLIFGIFFSVLRTKTNNNISKMFRYLLYICIAIYVLICLFFVVSTNLSDSLYLFLARVVVASATMMYFLMASFFIANAGFEEDDEPDISTEEADEIIRQNQARLYTNPTTPSVFTQDVSVPDVVSNPDSQNNK